MQDQKDHQLNSFYTASAPRCVQTSVDENTGWTEGPSEADTESICLDNSSDGRFVRVSSTSIKTPYGLLFNALDRDTGNEVLWHQIHVGKVDQTGFTKWMQELQNIIKLDRNDILNYLRCERRSEHELVLISEMITRGSLREYLTEFRKPRFSICQTWFRQILSGLDTLHNRKITHGRLTCDHIYINSNTGELKIGDLSLVKLPEILTDRAAIHRSIDDIHHFGLLALEIAFSQLLHPSKLKALMAKYYDAPTLDNDKVQKLVAHIGDPLYRSLASHCISAESGTTAGSILNHPFFSAMYGKDEVLRAVRSKRSNMQVPAVEALQEPPKQPASKTINVLIRIIRAGTTRNIAFQYEMNTDTPEGLAQEMRTILELPECYVLAFQSQFTQILVREYGEIRTDTAKGSESERTETTARLEDKAEYRTQNPSNESTSFIPGTISPIESMSAISVSTSIPAVDYWKSLYTQKMLSLPPPDSKKESTFGKEGILQPEVAFSDVQYTPRSGCDDDASTIATNNKRPKRTGIQDEDLRYLQKLLSGIFENKGSEELAGENEEGDAKRVPSI